MKLTLSIFALLGLFFIIPPKVLTTTTNLPKGAMLPTVYNNGIMYSVPDSNGFCKLYYAKIKGKWQLEDSKLIGLKHADKYMNISNLVYEPLSETFYFTANTKTGNLSLFSCTMKDFELVKPKEVKLAKNNINIAHSTFSKNGLNLIVSSGTHGTKSSDLFLYSRSDLNSEWKLQRGLTELNTTDLELHPTLKNDSTLYFTRQQLATGKMALWTSKCINNVWSAPEKIEVSENYSNVFGMTFIDEYSGYLTVTEQGLDRILYFENDL